MLGCISSREKLRMIDAIRKVTKVRAGHIHCTVLPEIILNTHRHRNESGFNAAAPGRNTGYDLIRGYNYIGRVGKRTRLRQGRKWRWRRRRLLATNDGEGDEPHSCRALPNHYQSSPMSDCEACPVEVAVVNPTLSRTKENIPPAPRRRAGIR